MFRSARAARRPSVRARTDRGPAHLEGLEPRRLLTIAYALTSSNTLLKIDTATPGTMLAAATVTGLDPGDTLQSIDRRPADGLLYGVARSGSSALSLYRIEPVSGAATRVGPSGFATISGTRVGIDFNPVSDRLRVVTDGNNNLRVHPGTGLLSATDGTLTPSGAVCDGAYIHSYPGATNTTLYGIDATSDTLVTINPPNNGNVNLVGSLGVNTSTSVGFDIEPQTDTAFAALTVTGTPRLYTINLSTGAATLVGTIAGGFYPIIGLALAPANHAPTVVQVIATTELPAVTEDTPSTGTRISDLITDYSWLFQDTDGPLALPGLAITAATENHGAWSFSTDGGANWNDLGPVYDFSARLLAADTQTYIRYTPSADFNGAADGLNVKAWDRTSGVNGGRADSAWSDAGAFSYDAYYVSVSVTAAYDAPRLTGFAGTPGAADDATVAPFSGAVVSYVDDAAATLTVSVALDDSAKGTFTPASLAASGFAPGEAGLFTFTGTAAAATAALRALVFDPADNRVAPGLTETTTFTVSVADGLGAPVLDAGAQVVSTSVNDAPVISGIPNKKTLGTDGRVKPFGAAALADADPAHSLVVTARIAKPNQGAFTNASVVAAGFIKVAKGRYQFTGTAAAATAALRKLRFAAKKPVVQTRITVEATDGTASASSKFTTVSTPA